MSFCMRLIASWLTTWAFTWAIYLSSISFPITWNFPLFNASSSVVVFTVERSSIARTSAVTPLSCGGVNCAPSSQYTLYPLYSGGLWLAVMLMPAMQPNSRTAKDSSGVGRRDSNLYALMPFAASVIAASMANSGDI